MARRPVFSAFNRPQSRKGNLLMYVRKDFHKSTGFIQIMDDALARGEAEKAPPGRPSYRAAPLL